jgi:hypothetical protein
MDKSKRKTLLTIAALLALSTSIYAAPMLNVTIIDRQNNAGSYTYVVPGYSNSNSDTTVNCYGTGNSVNCSGSTTGTTSSQPAIMASYQVTGATLSLKLPDGRVAVVNCDSKVNWTDFSKPNQFYRSCRVPLANNIQAEFNGDKAKLKWSVSIDGKKMESETYKILAVLDAH